MLMYACLLELCLIFTSFRLEDVLRHGVHSFNPQRLTTTSWRLQNLLGMIASMMDWLFEDSLSYLQSGLEPGREVRNC